MRCDIEVNLYVTRIGNGTIAIFSPDGILLHEVLLTGKDPSNIAFGGIDGRTCFVTMADRKMIEMFRTEIPGREWMLSQDNKSYSSVFDTNSRIAIYPNPTNIKINFSKLVPDSNITIVDITGRIMARIKSNSDQESIDVKDWKKGLYLVNIQTNRNMIKKKIIIK